jgi:branched-chain amino acid transport system substrate-binding protein
MALVQSQARFRAAVLLLLLVGAATACNRSGVETATIRIAAVAPITGAQAEVGQDLVNGERLAVDEVNAAGGVLGRQLELVVFDDAADPKEAVSVAQKIASDPTIVGVVGHMNSGTTKPASPVYKDAGIPVVMPVPTNPEITKQGFRNLFRLPPTDLDQGTDIARFAVSTLGKKRFAVVHDSTAYGQPLAEVFRKAVTEAEAAVVSFDGVSEGDKDFRSLLIRIRSQNPDALFFAGIYNEAGLLAKQAKELGVNATFLAADGSFSGTFVDLAGPAAEGAIMSFIAPDASTNEQTKTFSTKFTGRFGAIKAFAPLGYDAAKILAAGISAAGRADRQAVVEALHSPAFSYSGVTGESRFGDTGDNQKRQVFFYSVRDGRFVPYAGAK